MSETKKFYTIEQKNILGECGDFEGAKRALIAETMEARTLATLREQQRALQNIECILQRIERIILSAQRNQ